MSEVQLHELDPLESVFLVKWSGTVEDSFASYAAGEDASGILRLIGEIQREILDARNANEVFVCLKTRGHCLHHILDVQAAHVLVH